MLKLIQQNTEIVLMNGDTPLARISPATSDPEPQPRIPDLHPGALMSDDFTDPLPDEFWSENS